jgi:hypothetical protein
MKRNVQSLLLFTCVVPLLVQAGEETMEERKQRIARKYLRGRVDITYSEEVVPGADVEADDVLASEKFKEMEVDLERQEPGAVLPPPMRQPAPRTENRNWLLSEPEDSADPYADPYSRTDAKDEPEEYSWETWGSEREPAPYGSTQRESRYSPREYDSFYGEQSGSYDSTRQEGSFGTRTSFGEGSQPGFPQQWGRPSGSSEGQDPLRGNPFNSIFNPNRAERTVPPKTETPEDSFGSDWQSRTGGYTPYKSPYQTQREEQQERRGGYTPYKSPYQTQREQQQERWGGYNEPKQEYQRQDPYQQWKKNQPQFDPMSDDLFKK